MFQITLPDGSEWEYGPDESREVYNLITDYLTDNGSKKLTEDQHMIGADAEGWCELACIGDSYEDSRMPGLSITVYE